MSTPAAPTPQPQRGSEYPTMPNAQYEALRRNIGLEDEPRGPWAKVVRAGRDQFRKWQAKQAIGRIGQELKATERAARRSNAKAFSPDKRDWEADLDLITNNGIDHAALREKLGSQEAYDRNVLEALWMPEVRDSDAPLNFLKMLVGKQNPFLLSTEGTLAAIRATLQGHGVGAWFLANADKFSAIKQKAPAIFNEIAQEAEDQFGMSAVHLISDASQAKINQIARGLKPPPQA